MSAGGLFPPTHLKLSHQTELILTEVKCCIKTLLILYWLAVIRISKSFWIYLPCILESNPQRFYSFGGLKYQMRIRIPCGLDSRS